MSKQPFNAKPSRKELVAVIQRLQSLIGRAKASAQNDRDPNRMEAILAPLDEGFNLCLEAVSFDPPQRTKP